MTNFGDRPPIVQILRDIAARVRNHKPAVAHWAIGNGYIESILKSRCDRPEKDFDSQVRAHFDDPAELYRIAEGYCYVGLLEKACALYERIVQLNPDWMDVLDPHARALLAPLNHR
jgi:hypothetical protein